MSPTSREGHDTLQWCHSSIVHRMSGFTSTCAEMRWWRGANCEDCREGEVEASNCNKDFVLFTLPPDEALAFSSFKARKQNVDPCRMKVQTRHGIVFLGLEASSVYLLLHLTFACTLLCFGTGRPPRQQRSKLHAPRSREGKIPLCEFARSQSYWKSITLTVQPTSFRRGGNHIISSTEMPQEG